MKNSRDSMAIRRPGHKKSAREADDVLEVRKARAAAPLPGRFYPAREDSELLVPFARASSGRTFLEVGVGSGRVALEAARAGAYVVGTDLNPFALGFVREVAAHEGLRVRLVRTDLARGLGRFDRVAFNPPYLPTAPGQEDPDRWVDLALNGGPDGTRALSRFVAALPRHLAPGGKAAIVVSSLQAPAGLRAILDGWRALGGRVRSVARRRLEGEELRRLELWGAKRGPRPSRPGPGRTAGRPRSLRPSRRASTTGAGRGRTSAPGGA